MKKPYLVLLLGTSALLFNGLAHADDYQFPSANDDDTTQQQAAPKKERNSSSPKASMGPDYAMTEFKQNQDAFNLCDSRVTRAAKISHRLPGRALKMDLSDTNTGEAAGTLRKLECYAEKNNPASLFYSAEFELRQAQQDGAKSWEPARICGNPYASAAAGKLFRQLTQAVSFPPEKEELLKIQKSSKPWICADHQPDHTAVALTWDGPSQNRGNPAQVHNEMRVGYSDLGYETFLRHTRETTTPRPDIDAAKPPQDKRTDRTIIYNKSFFIALLELDYARDNLLATPEEERSMRIVQARDLNTGREVSYESAAVDGNPHDRQIAVLLETPQDKAPVPALAPRFVSVDDADNNAKGWFSEITRTQSLDEKGTAFKSIGFADSDLGQFLLRLDDLSAGQQTYMPKSQSDGFLRKLADQFQN